VVDNCSSDKTADEACKCGAVVLSCPTGGKGEAVAFALRELNPDIVIICDADYRGIHPAHFDQIVLPVIQGQAVQVCGLQGKSRLKRWLGRYHAGLTGFRAFRPEILWEVYPLDCSGWALETALNSICHWSPKRKKKRIIRLWVDGMDDVAKPSKYPTRAAGWHARLTVFWAVKKDTCVSYCPYP
jgi:glycosyltransferase involved in cell wall biosynthesis